MTQNGLQFDSNGNLLTTQTPSGTVTVQSGLPFDSTGSLCVSTNAIVSYQNGLGFDSSGNLVVQIG